MTVEPVTIAFVADTEIKEMLTRWAKKEDRSISSLLRQIILAEQERRGEKQAVVIENEEAVPAAA